MVNYPKKVCEDLGIIMGRRHRNRKKEHNFGDRSQNAGLPCDIELRIEIFSSLDRVILEINLRFQQLHELAEKYVFFTPTYLIDDQYECQLTHLDHDDIDKDEFLIERKKVQHFNVVATSHGETNAWKEELFALLKRIYQ